MIEVNVQIYKATLTEVETISDIYLFPTVNLSLMEVTQDLIILGCEQCNDGKGWITISDRETLKELYRVDGSNENKKVGSAMTIVNDELWYGTSDGSGTLELNSISMIKDL